MSDVPTDLISTTAAARLLKVQPRTVRAWIDRGRLSGWWVGGRIKVSEADVRACVRPVPLKPRMVVPEPSERAKKLRKQHTEAVLEKYGLAGYG